MNTLIQIYHKYLKKFIIISNLYYLNRFCDFTLNKTIIYFIIIIKRSLLSISLLYKIPPILIKLCKDIKKSNPLDILINN